MNTLFNALLGITALIFIAFIVSFYYEIKMRWRKEQIKMKRKKAAAEMNNTDPRKGQLRIPGYFEETKQRKDHEDYSIHTHSTII